jgi:pyrroloquinoline-quinone synthase
MLANTKEFIAAVDGKIASRKKMTSKLYQLVMSGDASHRLLRNFVIHRYPIKNIWTRNVMGIAMRTDDLPLRRKLVENIYEEETGAITGSGRHVDTFIRFGEALGVTRDELENTPRLAETQAIMNHNLRACNDTNVHVTEGIASVLVLMEGQPPIHDRKGASMEDVMRDVYGLPQPAYEFFTHHASNHGNPEGVSELEDEHAEVGRELLRRLCTSEGLQQNALAALDYAIELRHCHFDAVMREGYDSADAPFRFHEAVAV